MASADESTQKLGGGRSRRHIMASKDKSTQKLGSWLEGKAYYG